MIAFEMQDILPERGIVVRTARLIGERDALSTIHVLDDGSADFLPTELFRHRYEMENETSPDNSTDLNAILFAYHRALVADARSGRLAFPRLHAPQEETV